ncbi:MAG: hypothetical protein ABF709_02155 [Leuconostoc pseudomesenteroides]|uniref:hypothetical protein n=1 Tax=Leuconostoc pseudomesenteroides TaxID=33968 RepID=UPI001E524B0F|nr:hypothetical protein [Leuconostoc pseudomesenteroides]
MLFSRSCSSLCGQQQFPSQSRLSSELESQYRYENDKRTDEVIGYKAWFTQESLDPFAVKFEHQIKLPKYMALIEFVNLQAIEIRYNVYFKAEGLAR